MKRLIYAFFLLSITLVSCSKEDSNEIEIVNLVDTKWEGKGTFGGLPEPVKITLAFEADGKIQGYYQPNNWTGTYTFDTKTNKGVIVEDGDFKMPFEVSGSTLKFEIEPKNWVTLKKL